ncbi:uncharacterized protein [Euphorbia lathyris]|uniref:uncharacterized protein n=1 Tax=Euphorbia lathyris TaxID=212925 RepID=UPI0033138144
MEGPFRTLVTIALYFSVSNFVFYGNATDAPNYTVTHTEPDYEIRLYREISWISALARDSSFQKSTKDGFHRIYQYIHGSNLNSSQLAVTAPVLTSITQSSSSSGTLYYVMMFLSKANPPQPNPELSLQLNKWKAKCVAVRTFSGFADDENSKNEMEALAASIKKHSAGNTVAIDNNSTYIIAQYNSSRKLLGRLNEVWIDVSGYSIDGCLPIKGNIDLAA